MFQQLLSFKWYVPQTYAALFLCCIVMSTNAFGQDINVQRLNVTALDTANLKKDQFKLSQKIYLETYGFNDTARAVIKLYFNKRKSTKIIAYSNLGFLGIIRAAGQEEQSPLDPNFTPNSKTAYKPWVVPAVITSGAVCLFMLFRSDVWSLKSLIKNLYTYEKTGVLPNKLQKKLKENYFQLQSTVK